MADVTGGDEWNEFTDAFAKYLEAMGWHAVVVSSPRIQQQPGALRFNYEFVMGFTGSKREGGQLSDPGSGR